MLFDAPHHHAEMAGLHHNGDAVGIELLLQRFRNLYGQSFLYLKPSAERVYKPRNLAEADDLLIRQIADVAFAKEGEQVTG